MQIQRRRVPDCFSEKTRDWFERNVGEPTPAQAEGWQAIAEGGDVLISAPTGAGKTLTAFLYWLDRLAREPAEDACEIVYLSPLKALGNDIRENLRRPLTGLGLEETVKTAVRNGDTTQSERARMLRKPPRILITTPESLFLLLTSEKSARMLRTARCVIVDELHAVMDSKRGAHLMLSLERLDRLCGRRLQRIGLSATVEPLQAAADFLSGGRGAKIVAPAMKKKLDLRVEAATEDLRVLPEHSIWPAIAQRAYELSRDERAVLAFVDGRQQAEKLAFGVNAAAGGQYACTHHGCVSKEQRLEAERRLREGELKLLCCTSSMELGIDVGDIDLVLQIGAPASISGARQRAGRAGHGPNRISRFLVFPKTEADCLYAALAAKGTLEGRIEKAHVPQNCLDVLAQHLISMANAGEYSPEEALETVRGAWSFRNLTMGQLERVLEMLAGDFEHRRDVPARPRILYDRIHRRVIGDTYTRMLACSNVGTIPDRGWYAVTLEDGTRLGELDEEFVFEARLGDTFLLGAFAWRISQITSDRVIVTPASTEGAQSPFWRGDGMGRPLETGLYYGSLLREMNAEQQNGKLGRLLEGYPLSGPVRAAVLRYAERQVASTGCLPDDRTVILEHFSDNTGKEQLMVHSVFGGRVNRALAALLRHAAERKTGAQVRGYDDDDGVLLYLPDGGELPERLLQEIDPDTAEELLRALMPAETAFSMSFRYAAACSGMMGVRGRGRQPLWIQRLRGAEFLAGALEQEDHPLIAEAYRECMEDLLDVAGAAEILRRIRAGEIRVTEVRHTAPSPMALPLRRQLEAEMMYESPIPAGAAELAKRQAAAIAPDPEAVERRYERKREPDSAEALHTALMIEGDLLPSEAGEAAAYLEELAEQGRALYIEPGLWIAAEQKDEYEQGKLSAIVRRMLRYRGVQNSRGVAQRYAVSEREAARLLEELEARGEAVAYGDGYVHPDVYAAAQRLTLSMRRNEVVTAPPERFARWMAGLTAGAGSAGAQTEQAMSRLTGLELPAAYWEEIVLPARVAHYRKELLDALLAEGRAAWSCRREDGRLLVRFAPIEDDALDGYVEGEGEDETENRILQALERSGAQFDYALSRRLGGLSVTDGLRKLAERGLARQDSFEPVRRMLHPVRRAPARVSTGRWERMPLRREKTVDERLEDCFRLCPVLCRETCRGLTWSAALERLRVMELEGTVRRGYFVEGLSGAQFVRRDDFPAVVAALNSESREYVCLNAVDPAQMWGRVLRHLPGRAFACVPGTAVVLRGGVPVCLLERQGAALTMLEDDPEALRCFAEAFRERRIFPTKTRICVKEYPEGAGEWLTRAGFVREMLDYVLFAD